MRAKRRVITSCSECYRRKQKCDRKKPCNFCSARSVPELCLYDANNKPKQSKSSPSEHEHAEGLSFHPDDSSTISTPLTTSPNLSDQIGYSSAAKRKQFEPLEKHLSDVIPQGDVSKDKPDMYNEAYLAFIRRLPDEGIVDDLLNIHFLTENWSFHVLDENHFRAVYKDFLDHLTGINFVQTTKESTHSLVHFPALLFSVLAVALQFLDPEADVSTRLGINTIEECNKLSQSYIDIAQKVIDSQSMRTPTTVSVEYYLVKTTWFKNYGRGSEAWQCLGVSLRQAQEIDLHQVQGRSVNNSASGIEAKLRDLWEIEHSKRLWARLFVMDSHMAVSLGRPRGIHREDCCTDVPVDCEYPTNPSQTIPTNTNYVCDPPNRFSPTIFSIQLGHKYHDMMTMRATKRDLEDYNNVTILHNDIESLLFELPPSLRTSHPDTTWDYQLPQLASIRLRLLTTTNISLLALHRPYIFTHELSRHTAIKAALTILQAQRELFEIIPQAQLRLYGYSFYTIDAGLFLAAMLVKYSDTDVELYANALDMLKEACGRLELMTGRSSIAKTGATVLRRCCHIIESRSPSWSNHSDSSHFDVQDAWSRDLAEGFLEDFSTHVPDQVTRDFLASLNDSYFSFDASDNLINPINDQAFTPIGLTPFNAIATDTNNR